MLENEKSQYKPNESEIAAQKRRQWMLDEIISMAKQVEESFTSDDTMELLVFQAVMQECFGQQVPIP